TGNSVVLTYDGSGRNRVSADLGGKTLQFAFDGVDKRTLTCGSTTTMSYTSGATTYNASSCQIKITSYPATANDPIPGTFTATLPSAGPADITIAANFSIVPTYPPNLDHMGLGWFLLDANLRFVSTGADPIKSPDSFTQVGAPDIKYEKVTPGAD